MSEAAYKALHRRARDGWLERNKSIQTWMSRANRFGVPVSVMRGLFIGQGGECAICGSLLVGKNAHTDHDPQTIPKEGHIRALLCGPCNKGLGHFRDSAVALRMAADYLEEHRS